jgi:hypothetical protein
MISLVVFFKVKSNPSNSFVNALLLKQLTTPDWNLYVTSSIRQIVSELSVDQVSI